MLNKWLCFFCYNKQKGLSDGIKTFINNNEKILWEGKPNKKCFILESIFNSMLPFSLLWAALDIFALSIVIGEGSEWYVPVFLLIHMMPVWLYLGGVILSFRKYKNTYFIITDTSLYTSGGSFSYHYDMKPWAELSNISIERGIFDQYLGVGDVCFYSGQAVNKNGRTVYDECFSIINIPDYEEVFKLSKQLQKDIYSDTLYPNDLRPKTNKGYKTEYINEDMKK